MARATTIFSFILGWPAQNKWGGLTPSRMLGGSVARIHKPEIRNPKQSRKDGIGRSPKLRQGKIHHSLRTLFFAVLLSAGAAGAAESAHDSVKTNSAGTNSTATAGTNTLRRAYEEAKAAYVSEPTNSVLAWKFARACFDLIDPGEKNPQRAQVAQEGIGAAEGALTQDSKSAPAHYYLAMNLGELARTKSLGALRLVSRMEREFLAAIELDAHFDHAGPERNLGTLYRDAPVIGSVGSRSKARLHLRRAVELEPEFPENRMVLLEACVKWGDWNEGRAQLKALDELWPAAQKAFAGEEWVSSWTDWEARIKLCRGKVASHPPK